MSAFVDRIAAAPVTWGVDGSPGWGLILPRDRVVEEMKSLGLSAMELGPDGFLPSDPEELNAYLSENGLRVIGGWVPMAMAFQDLFDADVDYLHRACRQFQLAGADVLILGPVWDLLGYEKRGVLDAGEWATFFANLSVVDEVASSFGLRTALHQHVGTVVEDMSDLQRVLDNSDVSLCVDTGHMMSTGIDPVAVVTQAADRVAHVHLKDVQVRLANMVLSGETPFRTACLDGLFQPLGKGDVDLAGVISTLEAAGYAGWYTIEQDCSLSEIPPPGTGPVEDCAISLDYLKELAASNFVSTSTLKAAHDKH